MPPGKRLSDVTAPIDEDDAELAAEFETPRPGRPRENRPRTLRISLSVEEESLLARAAALEVPTPKLYDWARRMLLQQAREDLGKPEEDA